MHADVVDSTVLVQKDESLAHERIVEAFKRFSKVIEKHAGHTHEIRGDALLAEFPRASDAISASIEFQRAQSQVLQSLKGDVCPKIRIGIAMGEVIIADNTMTGAGVVMAQRLEQLADSGGVIVQGAVYETVPKHLPFKFENIGKRKLKGFDDAIEAYRVIGNFKSADKSEAGPRPVFAFAFVTLLLAFAITLGWFKPWQSTTPSQAIQTSNEVSDKPTIAVLPFDNLSAEIEQDYFADGLTEDLITDLSKVSGLFVIARNSVFTYKDKPVNIPQVAEELGVRYVLEGSVRRAGNQVRINAQLIDAKSGSHLWAERYDGSLSDVFAMQDQVNQKIITALSVELSSAETAHWSKTETTSTEAHDAYLKGWEHYQRQTPGSHVIARDYLKTALQLDPDYNRALAAIAALYWEVHVRSWSPALRESEFTVKEIALDYLQRALVNPTPLALVVESHVHLRHGRHEKAIATAKGAINLSNSDADAQIALARALILSGRPTESIEPIKLAEQLDPYGEALQQFLRGLAEFGSQNFTAAASSLNRSFKLNSNNVLATAALAASLGHLKQKKNAKTAWQAYVDSKYTESFTYNITSVLSFFPYKHEKDKARIAQGLRMAEVPETYVQHDKQESTQ